MTELPASRNARILIFTVVSWNSHGGDNTYSSLLRDYPSQQLASICIRDELPDSAVCSRYFRISEVQMLRHYFKHSVKTGAEQIPQVQKEKMTEAQTVEEQVEEAQAEQTLAAHNTRYAKYAGKRVFVGRMCRELVWQFGNWKTQELNDFIDSFRPDLILYSMEGYIHLNRIVRYAIKRTGARAIGYFWDDNFTYVQSKLPDFRLYRFFQRRELKKCVRMTDAFFAITEQMKEEADQVFGVNCVVLTRPAEPVDQPLSDVPLLPARPIRIVYTGNLLYGRMDTLRVLAEALREQKRKASGVAPFVLTVYSQTDPGAEGDAIFDGDCVTFRGCVAKEEVLRLQQNADILLFLEAFGGEKALSVRLSFSTKITDYLATGKCILAVGGGGLAPIDYFSRYQCGLTATNAEQLQATLDRLLAEPELIGQMGRNAARVGAENHGADKIRQIFDETLSGVLEKRPKEAR